MPKLRCQFGVPLPKIIIYEILNEIAGLVYAEWVQPARMAPIL
jgi:hypothetical protein